MASMTKTAPRSDLLHKWSIEDSIDLYNVRKWGAGFFSVNERGHISVSPRGAEGPAFDLKELVDELCERGIELPMLIRFSDILRTRIEQLNRAFAKAFVEHEYTGEFMGVKQLQELIREEFPGLKYGYFNPPIERIKGRFEMDFAH